MISNFFAGGQKPEWEKSHVPIFSATGNFPKKLLRARTFSPRGGWLCSNSFCPSPNSLDRDLKDLGLLASCISFCPARITSWLFFSTKDSSILANQSSSVELLPKTSPKTTSRDLEEIHWFLLRKPAFSKAFLKLC